MVSKAAQVVIGMETDIKLPGRCKDMQQFLADKYGSEKQQLQVFGEDEWTAPTASGGGLVDAMVVCPCSMGALSAIATGASNNLIERSADVMLKERRKLILVPRETPYSDIHLENMLKLSRMDAVILCANPGFYNKAETVDCRRKNFRPIECRASTAAEMGSVIFMSYRGLQSTATLLLSS
jgi:4-hydroxy-3-polyprenylbenzoate decarboxylase